MKKNKANKKGAAIKRCLYFLLSLISLTLKFYYFAVACFVKLFDVVDCEPFTDALQLFAFSNINVKTVSPEDWLGFVWVAVNWVTSLALSQLSILKLAFWLSIVPLIPPVSDTVNVSFAWLSVISSQVPTREESLKVGVGVVIEPPLSFLQETKATIKTDKKIRNNF